jgi:anti-sigma-K factor RskA
MNNANHILQDDLYLFALQLLPETEMQAASLHLKECPLCRSQLGEIQGDLAGYAMTAEVQAPPSQTRERLLRQVAEEKKIVPVARTEQHTEPILYPRNSRMFQMDAPEEREPRRIAPFMAWAGWSVAAAVAVVAGLQFDQRKLVEQDLAVQTAQVDQTAAPTAQAKELMQTLKDANAMQVSLHVPLTVGALPKLDPEAHATYVPGTGSLVFVASHLDPLQPGKTYELWLLPAAAGQTPVPSGMFKPDANGNATVVMPELPKGVPAKGFGVTVENEGGSKTPTAPIVLAGM